MASFVKYRRRRRLGQGCADAGCEVSSGVGSVVALGCGCAVWSRGGWEGDGGGGGAPVGSDVSEGEREGCAGGGAECGASEGDGWGGSGSGVGDGEGGLVAAGDFAEGGAGDEHDGAGDGGDGEVGYGGVVVRDAEGRGGVVLVDEGEVGVDVGVDEVVFEGDEVGGDDDVVEDLGAAGFDVALLLGGGEEGDEIDEVGVGDAGDGWGDDLVGGDGVAADDAEGVDEAVGELEGVVVAYGDDVLTGGLVGLDEVGEVFGLGLSLEADGGAGGGWVVDVDERALVDVDDGDGVVGSAGATDAGVEDEGGAVVEDGLGAGGVGEGGVEAELLDVVDVDGALDEEAGVDAGAVCGEEEVWGVGGVGLVGGPGVGGDLAGEVGEDFEVFDLLGAEDVGGVEDVADG